MRPSGDWVLGPCRGLRAKSNGVVEEANGTDCGGDESGGDPRSDSAGVRCHTILARGKWYGRAGYKQGKATSEIQRMENERRAQVVVGETRRRRQKQSGDKPVGDYYEP
jgi:hypothetical protein